MPRVWILCNNLHLMAKLPTSVVVLTSLFIIGSLSAASRTETEAIAAANASATENARLRLQHEADAKLILSMQASAGKELIIRKGNGAAITALGADSKKQATDQLNQTEEIKGTIKSTAADTQDAINGQQKPWESTPVWLAGIAMMGTCMGTMGTCILAWINRGKFEKVENKVDQVDGKVGVVAERVDGVIDKVREASKLQGRAEMASELMEKQKTGICPIHGVKCLPSTPEVDAHETAL